MNSSSSIKLLDARQIDAVVGLFDAQLREHRITRSTDDLRAVAQTVVTDPRYGFMLVANAPDNRPIGVAYASTILTLEHGGVSGWLEELYVLPPWRGSGVGSWIPAFAGTTGAVRRHYQLAFCRMS